MTVCKQFVHASFNSVIMLDRLTSNETDHLFESYIHIYALQSEISFSNKLNAIGGFLLENKISKPNYRKKQLTHLSISRYIIDFSRTTFYSNILFPDL